MNPNSCTQADKLLMYPSSDPVLVRHAIPDAVSDFPTLILLGLILQEHAVPHVLPFYPDKAFVVLQSNAAAAMQTCGPRHQCDPSPP